MILITTLFLLVIVTLFVIATIIKLNRYPSELDSIKTIIHGGAIGNKLISNTLDSIEATAKAGYFAIELDVQQTHDKKFVLFHDDFILDHDSQQLIPLSSLSFTTLTTHTKKSHFEPPLLKDAIKLTSQLNFAVNLDIKSIEHIELLLNKLINLINENNVSRTIWLSSFYPTVIHKIIKQKKQIPLGWIIPNRERAARIHKCLGNKIAYRLLLIFNLIYFSLRGVKILHPEVGCFSQKTLIFLKKLGFKVILWTVNDASLQEWCEKQSITYMRDLEISHRGA